MGNPVSDSYGKLTDALTVSTTTSMPLNNPKSTVPHRAKTAAGRAKVKAAQRTPKKRKSSTAPSKAARKGRASSSAVSKNRSAKTVKAAVRRQKNVKAKLYKAR